MTIQNDRDDGLTDEERLALEEDDGGGVDTSTDNNEGGGDGEKGQGGEDKGTEGAEGGDPAADAAGKAKPDGEPTAKADEPGETATKAEPQPAPVLVAQASAELQGKLTDIQAQKDALLTKFDEGDITAKEYQQQVDALNREERKLEREQDQVELAEKLNRQSVQNDWNRTCEAFIAENPIYATNQRLYKALDAEVKDLADKEETKNWPARKFLVEAHKNLAEAFNLPATGKPATPAATKKAPAADLPPNLAKVPAAETEDTSGNKYAALDRLMTTDPIAYEEAVNKMPKAERDAYMAAQ